MSSLLRNSFYVLQNILRSLKNLCSLNLLLFSLISPVRSQIAQLDTALATTDGLVAHFNSSTEDAPHLQSWVNDWIHQCMQKDDSESCDSQAAQNLNGEGETSLMSNAVMNSVNQKGNDFHRSVRSDTGVLPTLLQKNYKSNVKKI